VKCTHGELNKGTFVFSTSVTKIRYKYV